jgi:hypothetical protein
MEGSSLFLLGLVAGLTLFAGLGAYIASQKGRSVMEGFAMGLVFGPLGVIVAVLLPTLRGVGPRHRSDRLVADVEDHMAADFLKGIDPRK